MAEDTTVIRLVVDGRAVSAWVDNETLLLHFLREDAGATAPKWGCGTGDCGACTVLLDGKAVDSCLVYAVESVGSDVRTTTDIAATAVGTVIVEELTRSGGVQCGICTPGFVVAVAAALETLPEDPTREDMIDALSGNVCRCTGYTPLVDGALRAVMRIRSEGLVP
jgi:aerobic-type carbon monoxide dehydrogenase small subunit (CoxS/CutS family)